jgi:Flp pilus assembly protein TadG
VHSIHDADSQRTSIFARDTAGTAAIEFAIVAPLLIAIMLATLQVAVLFLVEAFFESSSEQAARNVLTNNVQTNPSTNQLMTASQFEAEICTQLTALFNCGKLIVELEPLPPGTTNLTSLLPQFNTNGQLKSTPAVDVGANAVAPGTDMLLVVMYPWPVLGGPLGLNLANFANNTRLLVSTQVFRVEPL